MNKNSVLYLKVNVIGTGEKDFNWDAISSQEFKFWITSCYARTQLPNRKRKMIAFPKIVYAEKVANKCNAVEVEDAGKNALKAIIALASDHGDKHQIFSNVSEQIAIHFDVFASKNATQKAQHLLAAFVALAMTEKEDDVLFITHHDFSAALEKFKTFATSYIVEKLNEFEENNDLAALLPDGICLYNENSFPNISLFSNVVLIYPKTTEEIIFQKTGSEKTAIQPLPIDLEIKLVEVQEKSEIQPTEYYPSRGLTGDVAIVQEAMIELKTPLISKFGPNVLQQLKDGKLTPEQATAKLRGAHKILKSLIPTFDRKLVCALSGYEDTVYTDTGQKHTYNSKVPARIRNAVAKYLADDDLSIKLLKKHPNPLELFRLLIKGYIQKYLDNRKIDIKQLMTSDLDIYHNLRYTYFQDEVDADALTVEQVGQLPNATLSAANLLKNQLVQQLIIENVEITRKLVIKAVNHDPDLLHEITKLTTSGSAIGMSEIQSVKEKLINNGMSKTQWVKEKIARGKEDNCIIS